MRKRLFAITASLIVAAGIALTGTPAQATPADCDTTITVPGYGEVWICYNHAPTVFSNVVLQVDQQTAPGGYYYVILHDWNYDGHYIYVEYQPWSSTAWYEVGRDIEGGPVTQSRTIQLDGGGVPTRYLRLRTQGSGSFVYLFKPVSGAGSGNGCGLQGVGGCTYL